MSDAKEVKVKAPVEAVNPEEPTEVAKPVKKVKKAVGGSAKPKKQSTHPPVSEMCEAAIESLKERRGSSLQAIKKYIAANYTVDMDRLAQFIRKFLRNGVASGQLVQTKGQGASGSFKLKDKEAKNKPVVKKAASSKKPVAEKEIAKKVAITKKTAAKKPAAKKDEVVPVKLVKTSRVLASKQKSTKPSKVPTTRTKAPIPKKSGGAKLILLAKKRT